jgi:hypothetical protein
MSFVTAQPDALAVSAGKLPGLGSAMNAGNAVAAAPTTGAVPAAGDEVSTVVQFAAHAEIYHAVSARAAAIQQQFVHVLRSTSVRTQAPGTPARSWRADGRGFEARDFGALPPEINSASIHAGRGSGRPPKPLPAPLHSDCHQLGSVGRDHRWRHRLRHRSPTLPGWPDRATRRTAQPPSTVVASGASAWEQPQSARRST